MTVREFNGTSDELVTDIGAASSMTYGTVAVLLKFSTLSDFREFCMIHSPGNTFVANPIGLTNFSAWQVDYNNGGSDFAAAGPAPSVGPWLLVVARKGTGTVKARLSMYNYSTSTWAHNDANNAIGDGTAPGAGAFIRFSFQGSSLFFGGRIAARALWANSLPWSSDAAGDAAIVASGLATAASSWRSANPTSMWLFNQASVATAVTDVSSAGTAVQTSISGTTVITGDDPPGFDFSLGGTTPVTQTRSTSWDTKAQATATRATTWNADALVTATRSTTWNVLTSLAFVTATRSTTWNVAGTAPVTASRSTTWNADALVTNSRSLTWNTASDLIDPGLPTKRVVFPTYQIPLGRNRLLRKYLIPTPSSLVKVNGEWVVVTAPALDLLEVADAYFIGGYTYPLTDAEVIALGLPPQYVEPIP